MYSYLKIYIYWNNSDSMIAKSAAEKSRKVDAVGELVSIMKKHECAIDEELFVNRQTFKQISNCNNGGLRTE